MRILVTGATGFIGLPLIHRLVGHGHSILALSRSPLIAEKSIDWLRADLSIPKTYQDSIRSFEPEILIHLAWQDIPDFSFNLFLSSASSLKSSEVLSSTLNLPVPGSNSGTLSSNLTILPS